MSCGTASKLCYEHAAAAENSKRVPSFSNMDVTLERLFLSYFVAYIVVVDCDSADRYCQKHA